MPETRIKLDTNLLEQLGIVNWRMHSQFIPVENSPVQHLPDQDLHAKDLPDQDSSVYQDPPHEKASAAVEETVQAVYNAAEASEMQEALPAKAPSTTALVFVGMGLEQVWQNEESAAWRLMLNILNALEISEEDVLYFDTGLLHTEDAIWMTLEEIIDTGVEQVFSFDEESLLNEALSEGLQVEILPSLDAMLMQGYAKKQGYYRLANYVR